MHGRIQRIVLVIEDMEKKKICEIFSSGDFDHFLEIFRIWRITLKAAEKGLSTCLPEVNYGLMEAMVYQIFDKQRFCETHYGGSHL